MLAAASFIACPGAAEDYVPKQCAAAVEYVGAPLHAPPDSTAFSGLDGDMTGFLDDSLVARLDRAVGWILANTAAPGITAAVGIPGEGLWSVSRGLARLEPRTPFASQALFYWASVGKAFTAAVVSQLIEEGKLSQADTLARWFPEFPNARAITIDHLLTHTSGAFSFNADLKFRRRKGYTEPDELIRVAARHGNAWCPGERWSYSNTGYVLLARIIEQIDGRPFHASVTRRVIERLGLRGTIALAPRQRPSGLATGHVARRPEPDFDCSMPFGAGIIVAPAEDMVRFWQAMLAGRLVGAASVRHAYDHLYPMFDPGTYYGRGVMLIEFRDGDAPPNVWLGHGGGTPSAKAVIAYDTASRVFIAVAINGDVSAEAAAYRLLREVRASRPSGKR
jgi:D-alanyl-D-alanine carboxypeptidase